MVPKVYFAFHYQRDIWRVNQVRNCHVIEGVAAAGFEDGSLWEEARKKGDGVIKKMIDEAMAPTEVTAVLIGSQTANREFVEYEIKQAQKMKKGLIGIYIHQLEDQNGEIDAKGENPITKYGISGMKTYDWVRDNGYKNFGEWVEEAVRQASPKVGKVIGAGAGAVVGAVFGPVGVILGVLGGYFLGDEIDKGG